MPEHVIGPRSYVAVLAALLLLTAATLGLARLDLGGWHGFVGLAIALAKALLVVLFFMHVLYSPRLIWVIVMVSVFWLGILLALTMTDYLSRGWNLY